MHFVPTCLPAALLTLTLNFAAAGGAHPRSAVDAFTVYNAAAGYLNMMYAGPNMLGVGPLLDRERAVLTQTCARTVPCPEQHGRTAVNAVVRALGDLHTSVKWDTPVEAVLTPPQARLSGLWLHETVPGELRVTHVNQPSDAARAGVLPGDTLIGLVDEPSPAKPADLARVFQQAEERGQPFKVRLKRDGRERTVTLTGRPGVVWPMPSLRWEGRVAVISLPSFRQQTGGMFAYLITLAHSQRATDLVVDLRHNRGGYSVELMIAAAALNLDTPDLFSVPRDGMAKYSWKSGVENSAYVQAAVITRWKGPVAVLTSKKTASSGELLAYFAQRSGVTVIGEPTIGIMNTSSGFHALPGGSTLAVTTLRTTVGGREWLPAQVTPDQVVFNLPADLKRGHDAQMQAGLAVVRR